VTAPVPEKTIPQCPVCKCCKLDRPHCDIPGSPCTDQYLWAKCKDARCSGVVVRLSDMHVMGQDYYGGKK
jgi:hypothetical protein